MSRTLPTIYEPDTSRRYIVGRPAALRLTPIDTSFSFHSNSTTATSSSTARTAHAWSSTGKELQPNLHPSSALSPKREEVKTLSSYGSPVPLNHRHHLHSVIPSPPLLSARSSAFLAALQQSFYAAIDTYVHHNRTHSSLRHQASYLPEKLEVPPHSPKERRNQPLSHLRKVATAIFSALIIAVITMTAFFASKNHSTHPTVARHLIMGGSATIVALISLLMLAADRSVKEILAMAAVAFTICQCIQTDLSSSF
jgi:hypothetical protein